VLTRIEYMINTIARSLLSSKMRRLIADFPGVLRFNEHVLGKLQVNVLTPEGMILKLNPLFHGHLATTQRILAYEPEVREIMLRILKPGMVVYDIGANIGVFSLLMSHLVHDNGKVYAIEPEINNYKHLIASIKENKIINIIAMQMAIGQAQGMSPFDRRGGSFSGRIIDIETKYRITRNIIEVPTVSLDDLVLQNIAEPPDFIKIDVEGYEGKVILGMKKVVFSHAPVILCELHTHLGDPSEIIYETLRSADYSIYELQSFLNGRRHNLETLTNVPMVIAIKDNINTREK
jgi:FkbM family methyltransferase